MTQQTYSGVDRDEQGGMTHLGRMVRDAWVFGILPETETCAGWDAARMQNLYEQVYAAWEPYAHLPNRLPPQQRERHEKIYTAAMRDARERGWNAELGEDD